MRHVVVVTGAARGIGRGLTRWLLEHDISVAALDVDSAALSSLKTEAGAPAQLLTVECDVSSEQQVSSAFLSIQSWNGRIDGLVNNAARATPHTPPLEELSLQEWRHILATNLDGVFLCSKAGAAALARTRGAIVNIASTRALQSEPNSEAYAASKGAVVALTHAMAISLGPEVRVNAVSPGWIDTSEYQPGREPLTLSATDHEQHPVGRVGTVADVAELTAFLLSERAAFITGQNFVVDGGMTRKMIYAD